MGAVSLVIESFFQFRFQVARTSATAGTSGAKLAGLLHRTGPLCVNMIIMIQSQTLKTEFLKPCEYVLSF